MAENPDITDEMVSNFLAFTGSSDPAQASSYLEMSGCNLETAVGLYLEHNGGSTPTAAGSIPGSGVIGGGIAASGNLSSLSDMNYSGITNDSSEGISSATANSSSSAAVATAAEASSHPLGEDGVRAPDQTRTMRLMDDGHDPYGRTMSASGIPGILHSSTGRGVGSAFDEAAGVLMGTFAATAATSSDGSLSIGNIAVPGGHGASRNHSRSGSGTGSGSVSGGAGAGRVGGSSGMGISDMTDRFQMIDSLEYSRDTTLDTSNLNESVDARALATAASAAAAARSVIAGSGDAVGARSEDKGGDGGGGGDGGESRGEGPGSGGSAPIISTGPPAGPTLSDMFAPPINLMHRAGGFQGARNVARDARRWLLVNLQRDEDFACHALNRDVWRDELVENLVREGFIFWQQTDVTPDGVTYVQRYNVQAYPHVAILDPRTGRLMWKKEGWTQVDPMTAEHFAEIAADFCSRHSFDRPPTAPRIASASASSNDVGAGASVVSASASPRSKRPIHEMTEEEQLQAAIRASMKDGAEDEEDEVMQGSDNDSDIVLDDSDEDGDDAGADNDDRDSHGATKCTASAPAKKRTMVDEFAEVDVGEEPAASENDAVRVQFRMPDGARVVRRFRRGNSVKVIYAFVVKKTMEDAQQGRAFELRAGFPPKDLYPHIEGTVESSGLAGGSITVRWKTE